MHTSFMSCAAIASSSSTSGSSAADAADASFFFLGSFFFGVAGFGGIPERGAARRFDFKDVVFSLAVRSADKSYCSLSMEKTTTGGDDGGGGAAALRRRRCPQGRSQTAVLSAVHKARATLPVDEPTIRPSELPCQRGNGYVSTSL